MTAEEYGYRPSDRAESPDGAQPHADYQHGEYPPAGYPPAPPEPAAEQPSGYPQPPAAGPGTSGYRATASVPVVSQHPGGAPSGGGQGGPGLGNAGQGGQPPTGGVTGRASVSVPSPAAVSPPQGYAAAFDGYGQPPTPEQGQEPVQPAGPGPSGGYGQAAFGSAAVSPPPSAFGPAGGYGPPPQHPGAFGPPGSPAAPPGSPAQPPMGQPTGYGPPPSVPPSEYGQPAGYTPAGYQHGGPAAVPGEPAPMSSTPSSDPPSWQSAGLEGAPRFGESYGPPGDPYGSPGEPFGGPGDQYGGQGDRFGRPGDPYGQPNEYVGAGLGPVETEAGTQRKPKKGLLIGVAVAVLVVLGAGGVSVAMLLNRSGGGDFKVGTCVKQSGTTAVSVKCTDKSAFEVVSKVGSQANCPDQNQPFVVIPRDGGKNDVLCLRPAGGD